MVQDKKYVCYFTDCKNIPEKEISVSIEFTEEGKRKINFKPVCEFHIQNTLWRLFYTRPLGSDQDMYLDIVEDPK